MTVAPTVTLTPSVSRSASPTVTATPTISLSPTEIVLQNPVLGDELAIAFDAAVTGWFQAPDGIFWIKVTGGEHAIEVD